MNGICWNVLSVVFPSNNANRIEVPEDSMANSIKSFVDASSTWRVFNTTYEWYVYTYECAVIQTEMKRAKLSAEWKSANEI